MLNSLKKTKMWNTLAHKTQQFADDCRGVSMVEFAIAAPVLITLILGASTAMQMANVSAQGSKATATVADIISQAPAVDDFAITNAFRAADYFVPQGADLEMYVAGIEMLADTSSDTGARPVVLWARGNKAGLSRLSLPAPGSLYNQLPQSLEKRTGFMVVTRSSTAHAPLYGKNFVADSSGRMEYKYSSYFVPRISIKTLCDACD